VGLEHLSSLTNLSILSIRDTRVTDAGLLQLTGLVHLQEISIGGTAITPEGKAELQQKLPGSRLLD
jgi:hypothetical protein